MLAAFSLMRFFSKIEYIELWFSYEEMKFAFCLIKRFLKRAQMDIHALGIVGPAMDLLEDDCRVMPTCLGVVPNFLHTQSQHDFLVGPTHAAC